LLVRQSLRCGRYGLAAGAAGPAGAARAGSRLAADG